MVSTRSARAFASKSTVPFNQCHRRSCQNQLNADIDPSELAREKMWSRIYLIPVLQAEEDRDLVRRYYADKAREKALLGSETSVYNSDRCVQSISTVVANTSVIAYLTRRRC